MLHKPRNLTPPPQRCKMVATRRSLSPAPKRAASPARKPAARAKSPARKKKAGGKSAPFILLDPKRMPFWLYAPNLLGYIRVATLVYAMYERTRGRVWQPRASPCR